MDITKDDFLRQLPRIEESIRTASFIAIDEEFTGVSVPGQPKQRPDDGSQTRYEYQKATAEMYKIIQMGVCTFHRLPSQDGSPPMYEARPFNFFIFPESGTLTMSSVAIHFNKTHGMDFNKWIYNGVHYVTADVEAKLTQPQDFQAVTVARKPKYPLLPQADTDKQFLSVMSESLPGIAKQLYPGYVYHIPNATPFQERLLRQWLSNEPRETFGAVDKDMLSFERIDMGYLNSVRVVSFDLPVAIMTAGDDLVLVCRSPEQLRIMRDTEERNRQQTVALRVGFRSVWNMICKARVPVITHNGILDLMYMWSHFESSKLPDTLVEFKKQLHVKLPIVYDTKFLAEQQTWLKPFQHTGLDALFEATGRGSGIVFASEYSGYAQSNKSHTAGFDAYMTGCVYAHITAGARGDLAGLVNRLPMYHHPLCLTLHQDSDVNADASRAVYMMKDFPSSFTNVDILIATKQVFGVDDDTIKITWIDESSLFLLVPRKHTLTLGSTSYNIKLIS